MNDSHLPTSVLRTLDDFFLAFAARHFCRPNDTDTRDELAAVAIAHVFRKVRERGMPDDVVQLRTWGVNAMRDHLKAENRRNKRFRELPDGPLPEPSKADVVELRDAIAVVVGNLLPRHQAIIEAFDPHAAPTMTSAARAVGQSPATACRVAKQFREQWRAATR